MDSSAYRVLVGAEAEVHHSVAEGDTAISLGSGDVPVLATPRLLAWLEEASVLALRGLPEDLTSVGIHVVIEHHRPNALGDLVVCRARVEAVSGPRVEFAVEATRGDGRTVVAGGRVVRAVVDRARFLADLGQ